MYKYSILLINKTKIDITETELPKVQTEIKSKNPCIIIGPYSFAYHQFAAIMPKNEADFNEKMELSLKGHYRCRKYGVIHKLGVSCTCSETGEINPAIANHQALLDAPN